jgi:YgiT-type zinc finger domain-containing protein
MPLKKEGDWEVVKGKYGTPVVCPWCGGEIEERLLEIFFLEGNVRVSKFPKMVCNKCGRSFLNDEQAAYYEKLQEDLKGQDKVIIIYLRWLFNCKCTEILIIEMLHHTKKHHTNNHAHS